MNKANGMPAQDRIILRDLAKQIAEIAALPIQQEKANMWRRLNRLDPVRPMVWINEIPWHEMRPELQPLCSTDMGRALEGGMRRTLYQWRHMRGDMTVDGIMYSGVAVRDTGYGLGVDSVNPDQAYGAKDYVPIIKTEADVERIQMPKVTVDWDATERGHQMMCELFGDIMPVERRGVSDTWFAPWDVLVQWWGIEELYQDMVDQPALVHKGIDRMVQAMICRFDQYEELNVLALNNGSNRVGSGGLGFSDELPQPDFDGTHVRPMDMWGSATPQIFSEVSPAMHEEFALQYERRILERFGLNCYGCCEPLHKKVGILRSVPRLRRISMSPFVNVEEGAQAIGDQFIYSDKPNPSFLAMETWQPETVRQSLREVLQKTRGCVVEVILKDIHTVRGEPWRLWEWEDVAMEVVEDFA